MKTNSVWSTYIWTLVCYNLQNYLNHFKRKTHAFHFMLSRILESKPYWKELLKTCGKISQPTDTITLLQLIVLSGIEQQYTNR